MKSESQAPGGGLKVSPAQPRPNVTPGLSAADRTSPGLAHWVSTVPYGAAAYTPSATQALFGWSLPPNEHE